MGPTAGEGALCRPAQLQASRGPAFRTLRQRRRLRTHHHVAARGIVEILLYVQLNIYIYLILIVLRGYICTYVSLFLWSLLFEKNTRVYSIYRIGHGEFLIHIILLPQLLEKKNYRC